MLGSTTLQEKKSRGSGRKNTWVLIHPDLSSQHPHDPLQITWHEAAPHTKNALLLPQIDWSVSTLAISKENISQLQWSDAAEGHKRQISPEFNPAVQATPWCQRLIRVRYDKHRFIMLNPTCTIKSCKHLRGKLLSFKIISDDLFDSFHLLGNNIWLYTTATPQRFQVLKRSKGSSDTCSLKNNITEGHVLACGLPQGLSLDFKSEISHTFLGNLSSKLFQLEKNDWIN